MKTKITLGFLCGAFALLNVSAQTIEVTSTGVGIGTNTPYGKFEVVGDYTDFSGGLAGSQAMAYVTSKSPGAQDTGATFVLRGRTGNAADYYPFAGFKGAKQTVAGDGDYKGYLATYTQGSSGTFYERMRVDGSGNVGIGTTTPSSKLQVAGQAMFGIFDTAVDNKGGILLASGTGVGGARQYWIGASNPTSHNNNNFLISDYDGGTNYPLMTIYGAHMGGSAGNVGIGTTAPSAPLEVNSSSGILAKFIRPSAGPVIEVGASDTQTAMFGYILSYDVATMGTDNDPNSLAIKTNGNVGIGTLSPVYKLEVAGSVRATSFIANSNTYADFVFKPGYKLAPLTEVESAIKAHGHLPNIPSESEAKTRGVDIGEMQVKLLQKVEELTLYLVAHEKEIQRLREDNRALDQLRADNEALRRRVADLEKR